MGSPPIPIEAAKARRVNDLLRGEYGHHTPRVSLHPTDSLVATILSQHTADRNSSVAFQRYKERYARPEDAAGAPVDELAAVIRPAGLANIKAERIQRALQAIQMRFGTMDLDFLRTRALEEAREILQALPGVGPKTAACVLLFSCNLPAMPVDTHVHRVSRRLGLIGPRTSADAAHAILESLVPPADVYDFHVNLIAHGRQVCVARSPRCGSCVLQQLCDYFGSTVWDEGYRISETE